MKYFSFRTKVVFFLSTLVVTVAAVSLTDLQSDEQSQRTIKVFGSYSGDALTLPDQLVCVISQLWKTEFVGQGNVHVKVNEKKCFGTGDGDEEITAIVNLSIDSVTGNTIGKIWYDDRDSIAFNGYDGIVYIKAVVSAAPTPSEPYGRFDISVVEQMNDDGQYAIDGDRFSTMRIVSTGNVFKFAAQTRSVTSVPSDINPAYSSFVTFSSFADRQAKRAAYKSNGGLTTVISYDSMNICFKTALNLPDCYPINDNSATVTVGAYGLYTTDGSRNFSAVTGHTALAIGGATNYYTMPNGFGGPIFVPGSSDPSTGPGLVTSSTAATLNGTPIKVAWLARTVTSTTPVSSGLTMDADTGLLLDPSALGVLIDIRNEIGRLPQEAISTPVRARAGKILE